MATVSTPWLFELQDRVAVPEPLTLVGVTEPQLRPEGTVSEIVIVPVKPFNAVSVMVDVPDEPTGIEPGEDALIVKSRKLKTEVAERTSDPLVPVIVSEQLPAPLALQETEAVPDPTTLAPLILPQLRPLVALSVKATVPVNPFKALI